MSRITRQFVVVVVAVAFLLTAVSGLVFYMPGRLLPVFGISLLAWRAIHEWSALVLTAAVVVHVALNGHRIGQLFARPAQPAGPSPVTSAPASSRPGDATEEPGERVAATAAAPRRLRLSRRRLLVLAAGALAAVIAALSLDRGGSRSAGGRSAASGAPNLEDFPVLNIENGPPAVAAADWVVEVDGLVESRLRLDRTAWLALPRTQETRDFQCVEGWSVDNLGWEGVRVSELLSRARPQPGGQFVTFHAFDGTYTDSLTLAEAQAPETLLADTLDGRPLPAAHGGPLRLVIPSQLGYKNVKWVVRLEVTATRAQGYWESNGYPAEAPVA